MIINLESTNGYFIRIEVDGDYVVLSEMFRSESNEKFKLMGTTKIHYRQVDNLIEFLKQAKQEIMIT